MSNQKEPRGLQRGRISRPGDSDDKKIVDVPSDLVHETPQDDAGKAAADGRDGRDGTLRQRNKAAWEKVRPHKPKWEAPQKITPEQLQEKLVARTPKDPAKISARRRAVGYGVLGLVAVGIVAATSLAGAQHDAAVAQGQSKTIELMGKKAEVSRSTGGSMGAEREDLGQLAGEAQKLAQAVATAQNAYAPLYVKSLHGKDSGNGVPNEAGVEMVEHRGDLKVFFEDSTFVISDEEATNWSTGGDLSANKIDPRMEWFVRFDPGVDGKPGAPSDPESYRWQVRTVMPQTSALSQETDADQRAKSGQATVVWECVDLDKDGKPIAGGTLAWASGTYENTTSKFSSLEVTTTSYGQKHIASLAAGDKEQIDVPELEEMNGKESAK